jgi:hypothetical protein
MARWIAPLIVALLLSVSPVRAETIACAPGTDGAGVTLNGRGHQNSRPVDLSGSYRATWALGAPSTGFIDMRLRRADGVADRVFLGELIVSLYTPTDGAPATRGEGSVFNLPAGRYYLDVSAPSEWSVTISPL